MAFKIWCEDEKALLVFSKCSKTHNSKQTLEKAMPIGNPFSISYAAGMLS
jgi:hypothetical protein